ncbi:hypothetical protein RHMOL_Rhmol12G0013600 [Rhododendron molle]|uniref:Uncharacterized protein n=1 Tax=Rhododendron molle TaxID=49168 RepID=A0ACC0LD93_RHOML|nr:hypothetical protein RHMOL_Rhmol12G0013600 [Rhododendron molle]
MIDCEDTNHAKLPLKEENLPRKRKLRRIHLAMILWTIKKLTNDSIFEGKYPRWDEEMDSIKLKGLRASVTEVAGAGTVSSGMDGFCSFGKWGICTGEIW